MNAIRTPEDRFAGLPGFDYRPAYRTWRGLRLAHIDVGAKDAPVALLLHGEPTWSYLYRSMIPPLLAAGYRVVAPDHAGFGRSDKPTDEGWYSVQGHVEALADLISNENLNRITLFVQDWGGPIGLRQVTLAPKRFERLAIMNTWLHHEGFEYGPAIRKWRADALDEKRLGGDMPTGRIVLGTRGRPPADPDAIRRAYDAPFTGVASKAGARRFPFMIPFGEPQLGQAVEQERDYHALLKSDIPKHFIWGDADPIFSVDWGRTWAQRSRNATFDAIAGAGHFLQDDAGEEIADVFLRRACA